MKKLNLKKLNRKQKNLIGIAAICLIVLVIVIIAVFSDNSSTIEQNFHIADTQKITKIVIKNKDDYSVLLEKGGNDTWTVNKKFEANDVLIKTLLQTFGEMRIREPLPKAARNNVVKDLASIGKIVDVYTTDYKINLGFIKLFKAERLKSTYYVGGETPDEMGTFMLKKGDDTPYIVYIPNFRGYLSTRFSVSLDLWRSHNLFKYKQSDIESISVEIPNLPSENYTLINNGKGFSFMNASGEKLSSFDTNKVVAFLSSFVDMNYESAAKNIPQIEQDTIFSKPPSFVITVKDKKGTTQTLKTFEKLNDPTSIAKDEKDMYNIFDINRCYALSSKLNDTLIMQFFTLDNVLKPASYFMTGAEGLPYIK